MNNSTDVQQSSSEEYGKAALYANIEVYKALFDNTENPLCVWNALADWLIYHEQNSSPIVERQHFPSWILVQLLIWARRMDDLSRGLDYRQTPLPFGILSREPASVERANRRVCVLDPPAASKLAMQALGLKRPGWNAFRQARRQQEQTEEAMSIEVFKGIAGAGDAKAHEMMLEEHAEAELKGSSYSRPLHDERSIRRRVSKSRTARPAKPA